MAEPKAAPGIPDPESGGVRPARGGGPAPGCGFALLGVIALGFAYLINDFSCFTVTDASCGSQIHPYVLIFALVGALLIAWAIVSNARSRR